MPEPEGSETEHCYREQQAVSIQPQQLRFCATIFCKTTRFILKLLCQVNNTTAAVLHINAGWCKQHLLESLLAASSSTFSCRILIAVLGDSGDRGRN